MKNKILDKSHEIYMTSIFDLQQVDDGIEEFKKQVNALIPPDYDRSNVMFSVDYFGYDGGYNLNVLMYRYETDEEYKKRINHMNRLKQNQTDKERKLYEKLKKKFENET